MVGSLLIRTMSRAELDLVVDWAAIEGWNPGWRDASAFHAADPGGFLVAVIEETPVACLSVVRYGDELGFLGFYITRPEARGRGYGMTLWRAGMERLAGRNVGLDGVPAQQENYRKSGFAPAWRNVRFEGVPPALAASSPGLTLLDATAVPFDRIAAFDRRFFPARRDAFLSLWISLPGHRARVAVRDGEIAGFAVARPCRRGTKIGPLHADDRACALVLLGGLDLPSSPGPVVIDVPEPNEAATRLADGLSLSAVFETARMYTGPVPGIDLSGVFGVTTFELG